MQKLVTGIKLLHEKKEKTPSCLGPQKHYWTLPVCSPKYSIMHPWNLGLCVFERQKQGENKDESEEWQQGEEEKDERLDSLLAEAMSMM